MEAKTVKNLSAALVCIFIFAVMILVGGLTYYYRRGVENADHVFSAIVERITSLGQGAEEQTPDAPLEHIPQDIALSLNEAVDLNTNLAALAIKINSNVAYARPLPSQYFIDGPDGLPAISGSSVILKMREAQFTIQGAPVVVTALIYILQPADIFKSARIAFLMVLAATLAAIILLVYLKMYPAENPALVSPPQKEETPPPPVASAAIANASLPESQQSRPQTMLQETEPPIEQGAPVTPLPPLLDEEREAPTVSKEPALSAPAPDDGMYSPETGLIRERYLSQGLASALSSAETAETDLALFIIAIPGLSRTSSAGKLVCTVMGNHFKTPGRIYEYKDSDFAAVVPGADFDKAVQAAEKIYVRLNEILTPFNPTPEIGIGISNRLTRVVTASRLINETEHAVEKALADPENPIVALKINMDKYRKYSE